MMSYASLHMCREGLVREGLIRLLELKDSDIRILTVEQARDAVDKGLHAGGAFSAVIPLVALYYGGFMKFDVADPTRNVVLPGHQGPVTGIASLPRVAQFASCGADGTWILWSPRAAAAK